MVEEIEESERPAVMGGIGPSGIFWTMKADHHLNIGKNGRIRLYN